MVKASVQVKMSWISTVNVFWTPAAGHPERFVAPVRRFADIILVRQVHKLGGPVPSGNWREYEKPIPPGNFTLISRKHGQHNQPKRLQALTNV